MVQILFPPLQEAYAPMWYRPWAGNQDVVLRYNRELRTIVVRGERCLDVVKLDRGLTRGTGKWSTAKPVGRATLAAGWPTGV